jgi:exosortase/archaeosortase family protein
LKKFLVVFMPSLADNYPTHLRFRERLLHAWKGRPLFDQALSVILFIITVALFWPSLAWIAQQTIAHEQLQHAFIILAFACLAIIQTQRKELPVALSFGKLAQLYLGISFAVLFLSHLFVSGWGVLLAGSLAIISWILFVCGPGSHRSALALIGVFAAYTSLIILLPLMDWPLRINAGQQTVWVLGLFGIPSELHFISPESPKLLLLVQRQPFEVAAECNGFGILASNILVALLLALFRPSSWIDKGLLLISAAVLGIAFNTFRILGIVIVAPHFPRSAYMTIHEIIGVAAFWGSLVVVWMMANSILLPPQIKDRTS